MKVLLKPVLFTLFALTSLSSASAHEGHANHEEMSAGAAQTDGSIYQLDSTWTDQNGNKVNVKELSGAPTLVALLYTRCQTACPLIVDEVKGVLSSLPEKQRSKVKIAVFSIDSENETPETLRKFIEKRKLDEKWRMFTAAKSDVASLAAALGFRYKRLADGEYVHSNVIYLLNPMGEISAQKEGFKTSRTAFVNKLKSLL